MSSSTLPSSEVGRALEDLTEKVRLELVRRRCERGPHFLLAEITAFSPDQQDEFRFNMFDPGEGWFWQRELVDRSWRTGPP
jgi:hypothetical protein